MSSPVSWITTLAITTSLLAPTMVLAQSEEKTFKSTASKDNRSDACNDAKEAAQRWLKENTDRSHSYFLVNQMKRGWPAKSDGTSSCDCSVSDKQHICTVDAKISAIR